MQQFEQITKGHLLGSFGWKDYLKGLHKVHIHPDAEPTVKPVPGAPVSLSVHG